VRQPNYVGRLNNAIRQRFGRFVRKVLSFCKKEYMLNPYLGLWAYQYNLCITKAISKNKHYP
jgi:hypothetical protein